MQTRLIFLDGPLKGTSVPVDDEVISIGRDESNLVSIDDALVSRHHARIEPSSDGFRVHDLESRNGVFIGGVPISERVLQDGDRIRIGRSTILFAEYGASDDVSSASVELWTARLRLSKSVELDPSDVMFFDADRLSTSIGPAQQRVARDLSVLLRIGPEVCSARDLDEIQRAILERLFTVVPADRGAILLRGRDDDGLEALFGRNREAGRDRPVVVSRTVVDYVMSRGVSVLTNDVSTSVQFGEAPSLNATDIRSVLAAPLILRGKVVGCLYLDGGEHATFDEGHLQLVSAVAGMAAPGIENARSFERLELEKIQLREEISIEHDMVGESERMRDVLRFVARVAATDSTVLIGGESGTGKELVARAVHRSSPRARKPFAAINCAALTESLLESELFGHEKGAFTGAVAQRRGKLEAADGGTVFLDEVGELAPVLQAKLLRAIQEREFERVGGTRSVKVDVRFVAATNRNLSEAVAKGQFRQDLFYRLNVVSLTMPPLRERRSDIPLLASYFIRRFATKCNRQVNALSSRARALMMSYDWPGNVRELQNAIERAVALGSSDRILPEDLPEALLEGRPLPGATLGTYHDAITKLKRQLVLDALDRTNGKLAEAARLLGVHRNYVSRLIRTLDLKIEAGHE